MTRLLVTLKRISVLVFQLVQDLITPREWRRGCDDWAIMLTIEGVTTRRELHSTTVNIVQLRVIFSAQTHTVQLHPLQKAFLTEAIPQQRPRWKRWINSTSLMRTNASKKTSLKAKHHLKTLLANKKDLLRWPRLDSKATHKLIESIQEMHGTSLSKANQSKKLRQAKRYYCVRGWILGKGEIG